MVIRNIKGYNKVRNLLITFKALSKELIIKLANINEKEFNELIAKHGIFQIRGSNLYGLLPVTDPSDQLIKIATVLSHFPTCKNPMLVDGDFKSVLCQIETKNSSDLILITCLENINPEHEFFYAKKLLDKDVQFNIFIVSGNRDREELLSLPHTLVAIIDKNKRDKDGIYDVEIKKSHAKNKQRN